MITCVVLLILTEAVSLQLTLGALFPSKRGIEEKRELCTSKACMRRARNILSVVDQAADPCEDFYEYACAGRTKPRYGANENDHPLAAAENILSSVYEEADIGENSYATQATPRPGGFDPRHRLAEFFNSQPNISEAKNVTEKAIMLYQACKSSVRRQEEGIAELNRVLDEEGYHEWPLFNGTKMKGNKFKTLEELILQTGFGDFIEVNFRRGVYERMLPMFTFEATITPMLFAMRYVRSYDFILEKLRRNGTKEEAQALQNDCPRITTELMQVYNGIFNNQPYWQTTFEEVEVNLPSFPAMKILNHFLKDRNMSVRHGDPVLIHKPMIFKELINYLSKNNLDDIYNCMGMSLAGKILLLFPQHMSPNKSQINATLLDHYHSSLCLNEIDEDVPAAMTRLYMLQTENLTTRISGARSLLNSIGKAFYTNLKYLPWLDRETRQGAIKKLWDMTPIVGHSDNIMNETILESLYDAVGPLRRSDSVFEIIRSFIKNNHERAFNFFRKGIRIPPLIYKYEIHTGLYVTTENAVVAPYGLIYGRFDPALPRYLNLAGAGFVMAHELGHGYDIDGSTFDGTGVRANWWSNYSREEYIERARCLVEQYGSIVDPTANLSINGNNTLSENIADNAAIKVAHMAFRTYDVTSKDIALPGLENFTSEQLFFIQFALHWCIHPKYVENLIKYDHHSPPKYRINVPLQNMEEFSATFHCKKGSRMRRPPRDRCILF